MTKRLVLAVTAITLLWLPTFVQASAVHYVNFSSNTGVTSFGPVTFQTYTSAHHVTPVTVTIQTSDFPLHVPHVGFCNLSSCYGYAMWMTQTFSTDITSIYLPYLPHSGTVYTLYDDGKEVGYGGVRGWTDACLKDISQCYLGGVLDLSGVKFDKLHLDWGWDTQYNLSFESFDVQVHRDAAPTPEPSSLALIGTGILGLGLRLRTLL
jgi:hypothetical protein